MRLPPDLRTDILQPFYHYPAGLFPNPGGDIHNIGMGTIDQMKQRHPAREQIPVETSDQDVAMYVSQLLSSLQKICDNRGMHMLSHLLKLAKAEANRLGGEH